MHQSFALNYGLLKTGLPLIIVEVFNQELCILLDTGSNRNIIDDRVYQHFKEKLPAYSKADRLSTLQSQAVEGLEITVSFKFESVDYCEPFINTRCIDSFNTIQSESGIQIHGILGSNFFVKHGWVINFDNLKVSVKKVI